MSHEDYTSVPALFKTFLTLIAAIGIIAALFYTATTSNFWSSEAATTTIAGTLPTPNSTLEDGLVGHWTFDGPDTSSTTVTDLSGQGNNGMLTNGPKPVAGQVGQALNFFPNATDTNAYVNIGDPGSGALDFGSGDFSVGFWMKSAGYVDQGSSINVSLAKKSVDAPGSPGYEFTYSSLNKMQLTVGNGTTDYYVLAPVETVNDNEWHYYFGIRSGNTIYLYIDGVSVGSVAVSGATSNSNFLTVGDNSSGWRNVNGSLDDTRIYNRALTPDEISQLYQHGKSDKINHADSQSDPLTKGLVGYWKLDETSGTTSADSSGNGNNGTLTNGPTWTTGQIDGAITFDGVDDYVNTNNGSASDNLTELTYAAWLNPTSANGIVLGKRSNGGGTEIFRITGGVLQGWVANGGGGSAGRATSISTVPLNSWSHVVMTYSHAGDKKPRLYINGAEVIYSEQDTNINGLDPDDDHKFWIGRKAGADEISDTPFIGNMDEVRVYNRALSAEEVTRLYRDTTPSDPESGLVGHWTFDGPDVNSTTAFDRSGSSNHGTLTNGPKPTAGKLGQGMSFDGVSPVGGYCSLGNPASLRLTGSMTLSAWVYPTRLAGADNGETTQAIITKSGVGGSRAYMLTTKNDGAFMFYVAADEDTWVTRSTNTSVWEINNWYLVTGVYNASAQTMDVYVNGVLNNGILTGAIPASQFSNNGVGVDIGGRSVYPDSNLKGSVDDVRIYNRALSADEVTTLYTRSKGVLVQSPYPSWAPYRCGIETVQDADGNVYDTILIGSQCWMKQNMRVGTRVNISTTQTNNATIEKWCYNDSSANCTTNHPNQPDGGLYQWDEAMQYSTTPGAQGICPAGWHIPTHDEFTTMELAICTTGSCATDFPYDTTTTGERGVTEGTKLKANGTSGLEFNLTGYSYVSSYLQGVVGAFWSSSESAADAWNRSVNSSTAKVLRGKDSKSIGWAVRCVKD